MMPPRLVAARVQVMRAGVVALGMRVVAGQVAAAAAMGVMMPAHRSQGWGLEAAMMMLVRVMMPMGGEHPRAGLTGGGEGAGEQDEEE